MRRATKDDCYEKLCSTIREFGLLEGGDRVLVALSGGGDSVALLSLLLEYRDRRDPSLHIECCHLNHMLRGEASEGDEGFSRDLCGRLGVACVCRREDVGRLAREEGIAVEEAARRVRYRVLRETASQGGANRVAVGHQADDNAETVLHRVVRGSGVRGLAGIPRRRRIGGGSDIWIVRPLLRHTAEELEGYLRAAGRRWRVDASNWSLTYTRNFLRHAVIPALEASFHPQLRGLLNRMADCARVLDGFARERVRRCLAEGPVERREGGVRFPSRWFARICPALRGDVLREMLERCGAPLGDYTEGHFRRLAAVCAGEAGAGGVSLPGRMQASRSGGAVLVATRDSLPGRTEGETSVRVPGVTPLPAFGGELRVDTCGSGGIDLRGFIGAKTPLEEVMDLEALRLPLKVRSWREGDRFRPLGAPGGRKLQDVFTDAKVPVFERRRVPLVCDAAGIVWVVGLRMAERVKLTGRTRRVARVRFARRN